MKEGVEHSGSICPAFLHHQANFFLLANFAVIRPKLSYMYISSNRARRQCLSPWLLTLTLGLCTQKDQVELFFPPAQVINHGGRQALVESQWSIAPDICFVLAIAEMPVAWNHLENVALRALYFFLGLFLCLQLVTEWQIYLGSSSYFLP